MGHGDWYLGNRGVRAGDCVMNIKLTRREREIARLVHSAMTNAEIARALRCDRHTVTNHITHIFNKVGCSNRVELALCVERGLLEENDVKRIGPASVTSAVQHDLRH